MLNMITTSGHLFTDVFYSDLHCGSSDTSTSRGQISQRFTPLKLSTLRFHQTWHTGKPTGNGGFNRKILYKECIFHCHVWFPEGNPFSEQTMYGTPDTPGFASWISSFTGVHGPPKMDSLPSDSVTTDQLKKQSGSNLVVFYYIDLHLCICIYIYIYTHIHT